MKKNKNIKNRFANCEKRYLSIRKKILFSLFAISIVLVFCVVAISYSLTTSRVERIGMQLSEQYVISTGEILSKNLSTLYSQTDTVILSADLRSLALLDRSDLSEENRMKYEQGVSESVDKILEDSASARLCFDFTAIFLKNGFIYQDIENRILPFNDFEECINYFSQNGVTISAYGYQTASWQLCSVRQGGKMEPVYIRYIYAPVTMEKLGIVIFGTTNVSLRTVYSGNQANSFILTNSGHILSSHSNTPIGTTNEQLIAIRDAALADGYSRGQITYINENNEKQIAFYYQLWSMQSYLISPFDLQQAKWGNELTSYILSILFLSGGLIIAAIVLSFIFSQSLTKSTTSLVRFIENVDQGNPHLRYKKVSNDEIGNLGDKINLMLDTIEYVNKNREDEMRANQAMELQLMQQQINPHLLYNTLNAVLYNLQQKNYDSSTELVKSLGEFFKLSLAHGQMEVPLANEIQLIEHFLTIQNRAKGKKYYLVCNVPEELLSHPVIKLTIQPLVENSVMHGFAGFCDDGIVSVSAERAKNLLKIYVTDNGLGIEEQEIEKLKEVLDMPVCPKTHRHFGLYNVHRRIVQKYGREYGLDLESDPCHYTKITVTLPYLPNESNPKGI